MDVQYDRVFWKQYTKAGPKIRFAFKERLRLLYQNPFHPLLHNHALSGEYLGYRSINVTGDWRALYEERRTKRDTVVIVFHLLGTHSQLYR